MSMISEAASESIALGIESVLYGIYILLFFLCTSILINRKRAAGTYINTRLFWASCALFVLISWHLTIDFVRFEMALRSSKLVADIHVYYVDVTAPLGVMKTAVYVAITIIADGIMFYRVWVVWNGIRVIVMLPTLLFLADVGTGIAATVSQGKLNETGEFSAVYVARQVKITESFFAITLALNGLCTILIASKVWLGQRNFKAHGPTMHQASSLNRVIVTIVESGAIYSATLILLVTTYVSQSTNAFQVFLSIVSPIIGIAFSLIIVRAGLKPASKRPVNMVSTLEFAVRTPAGDRNDASPSTTAGTTSFFQADFSSGRSDRTLTQKPVDTLHEYDAPGNNDVQRSVTSQNV